MMSMVIAKGIVELFRKSNTFTYQSFCPNLYQERGKPRFFKVGLGCVTSWLPTVRDIIYFSYLLYFVFGFVNLIIFLEFLIVIISQGCSS